jgi:hypothetical protein
MKQLSIVMMLLLIVTGCTGYKSQYIPFKAPEAYVNHKVMDGVTVGGEAYPDKKSAKKAFGFDIRGAGLLPVKLVLDNKSGETIEIFKAQTFLIDNGGNYWPLIPNTVAFDRLEKSTQFASYFGKGAGKGAVIGAVAGGILATALGIVSGNNVAEYLGKGAAMGGAGGAVIGGLHQGTSGERERQIANDLREKGLEGKEIPDLYLADGFLFFPGEAKSAKQLRLEWKDRETGKVHRVDLPLISYTEM